MQLPCRGSCLPRRSLWQRLGQLSRDANSVPYRILHRYVGMRVVSKPIGQRFFARRIRIEHIRVPRRDDFMKNIPDRLAIRICRWANF